MRVKSTKYSQKETFLFLGFKKNLNQKLFNLLPHLNLEQKATFTFVYFKGKKKKRKSRP